VSSLTTLASQMDASEAAALCGPALRLLLRERLIGGPRSKLSGAWDLELELLTYLAPEKARAITQKLAALYVSMRALNEFGFNRINHLNQSGFAELLEDRDQTQIHRRAVSAAMAVAQGASGQFVWADVPATEPFPCRLTTQELVELLKMPTCFGPTRRVVLDHLGNRYGHHFVKHWAFVRYAREHNLGLDFTTPPKRPDPKQSVERMIQALDRSGDGKSHGSSPATSGS
jgi:hypothetical protein